MNGEDVKQLAEALRRVRKHAQECPFRESLSSWVEGQGDDTPSFGTVLDLLVDNMVSEVSRACAVRWPDFNAEVFKARVMDDKPKTALRGPDGRLLEREYKSITCRPCAGLGYVGGVRCEACDGEGMPLSRKKGDVT